MKERRRFGQIGLTLRVLKIAMVLTTLLTLTSFGALIWVITVNPRAISWRASLVLIQVCFSSAVVTLLMAISHLVRRAIAPMARVENILDKVIAGDCTQRISLREKDLMIPFMEKVNAVIALLEKNRKS